jgi:hypothetical protein
MRAMRNRLVVLVLAACVVPACKGGMSDAECKREAKALRDLLFAAASEPQRDLDTADATLVVRTDLPPPTPIQWRSPVVRIGKNGIKLGTTSIADTAQLRAGLDTEAAAIDDAYAKGGISPRSMREPQRSYLVIDAGTPAREVAAVYEAVTSSKLPAVAFVFDAPSTVTPPPRSSIDPELDKLMARDADQAANRATTIAEMVTKEIARCPAAQKMFGSLGGDDSDEKGLILAEGINESLPECGCKVDIPRLRSLLFRVVHVEKPYRLLAIDPKAPAEEFVVDSTDTWAGLAKKLPASTKNVRFVVR